MNTIHYINGVQSHFKFKCLCSVMIAGARVCVCVCICKTIHIEKDTTTAIRLIFHTSFVVFKYVPIIVCVRV